jgi:hypothetical protein
MAKYDDEKKQLISNTDYERSSGLYLIGEDWYSGLPLANYLQARIPSLTGYIAEDREYPIRSQDQASKTITNIWKLAPGAIVGETLNIELYLDKRGPLPEPIKEHAFVHIIATAPAPTEVAEKHAPVMPPPRPLGPPLVLRGRTFPDHHNPDLLGLMVILNNPGYEIRFVTRVFNTAGGIPTILEENCSPWGRETAAVVEKPRVQRSGAGHLVIQYTAEIREPGLPDPVLTYIFDSK